MSDTKQTLLSKEETYEYECYYCELLQTNSQDVYELHVTKKHPGKLCYPNMPSLTKMGIKAKGKDWE